MQEREPTALRPDDSAETPQPFQILAPRVQTIPFVFNSPHSGCHYPAAFLAASRLDRQAIRRSEDFGVDALFEPVVALGAPLMRALFPRAYLDVNREPFELDPSMFADRLPSFANVRSLRVAGGLGTIPRVVADGQEIYHAPLLVADALDRVETIYKPYHDALRRLLARAHALFGQAILIDCHSMPSTLRGGHGRLRPDFVLGDRFGTSCAAALTERAASALKERGYTVSRNKPYAGGFITEHYGRPARGLHALQIEINRALYMDEERLVPHSGFERVRADLEHLARALVEVPETLDQPLRDAAE